MMQIFTQEPRLRWLYHVAERAGARLMAATQRRKELRVEQKSDVELVTDVDRELQELILGEITARYPEDLVIAEEQAEPVDHPPDGCPRWYVDPLDGTTNFVHGHPMCAVSIARWMDEVADLGVVHAPILGETFLAARGRGAWLLRDSGSGERLRASPCTSLRDALLATGFPYRRGLAARLNLACVAHALVHCRGIRRGGSAALDLCYVAAGRLDGFWELGLKPWDVAAGALIAQEAGASLSDFRGEPSFLNGGRICAAAPRVHAELLAMLGRAHADPSLDVLAPHPSRALPLDGPLIQDPPFTQERG